MIPVAVARRPAPMKIVSKDVAIPVAVAAARPAAIPAGAKLRETHQK